MVQTRSQTRSASPMVQTRSQTRTKKARAYTPGTERGLDATPRPRGVWASLCSTNVPWGTRRSLLIGGSAFAYLGPAVLDAARAPPHFFPARAALFGAQALACFWSDYVDSGRYAASHAIDRVLAPLMVVAVIGAGLARVGVSYVGLVALPTLATHHLSGRARRRGAFKAYTLWHALWHCLGGAAASLSLALAGAAPPVADGVDRALAAACARVALLRTVASGPCSTLASS